MAIALLGIFIMVRGGLAGGALVVPDSLAPLPPPPHGPEPNPVGNV